MTLATSAQLLFSLLGMLVGMPGGWESAPALPPALALEVRASVVAADGGSHAASEALQGHVVQGTSTVPPAPAAPALAVSGAEEGADYEELANLTASSLGDVRLPPLYGPASIQLEPSHAPCAQLDRPPRA